MFKFQPLSFLSNLQRNLFINKVGKHIRQTCS